MADIPSMMSISDQVHLVLIKTDAIGDTTLLSSHFMEWRPLLSSKQSILRTSIEMMGTGKIVFSITNLPPSMHVAQIYPH